MKWLRRYSLLLLLLAMLLHTPVLAEGGDQSGGGSGVPLTIASVEPADGAVDVELQPLIACQFTHNVAMAALAESNLQHLTLEQADGTAVGVETFVADIQLEFDKRRFLYLRPLEPLSPDTEYILHLTPGIQAKNGMMTQAAQMVRFRTMALPEPTAVPPPLDTPGVLTPSPTPTPAPTEQPRITEPPVQPAPTPVPDPTQMAEITPPPAVPTSLPEETSALPTEPLENHLRQGGTAGPIVIGAAALVIVIFAFLHRGKNRRKK